MSKEPTKLAIYLPSLGCGGAERSMLKLAHGLALKGYALDLVLGKAEGLHLAEVASDVHLVDLKASRTLASLPALVGYLRRERPAALLSAMNFANIVALWARSLARVDVRLVVREHNTLSVAQRNAVDLRSRLIPLLIKCFYPLADGIVAVSHGVADDLVRTAGLRRQDIHVIYNPLGITELRRLAELPVDHPWFGPDQPPVVLATGRLRAQKDYPTLIRAFARVRSVDNCRLLILGDGPDRPKLEALIRELSLEADVGLPGFVENPYPYMARASVFVLSSRWEGLPTVLLEALACGVPVISTDCPSGPREILAGGKYGLLVPTQDVAALAEAMRIALRGSLPRPPTESCRRYEPGTVADQYLSVLLGRPV